HNRADISRRAKFQRYLQTRRTALQQIKAVGYNVAFDLYWNFPNTLPLLWQAKIPMRVGYESAGFGPLATHCLEFGDKRLPASQRFLDLVKTLPLSESDMVKQAPVLPPLGEQASGAAVLEQELSAAGLSGKGYLVFHVGAADSFREWQACRWRELAERFIAQGYPVVFTGAGERDQAQIIEITEGLSNCINVCSRLEWAGFVATIARAQLLICVDTVAGHVAAATRTPCAVITAGRWPYLWRPMGPQVRVLMHPIPCAPCHRNDGCDGMECIQNTNVETVYQAGLAGLASKPVYSRTD
ncbi:MAG: glycosyltransferase family 9 protein, partial [Armatimonadota bacterium]|nr:glycosyltransferase family 9 protein [Armatimonadota bacterium]